MTVDGCGSLVVNADQSGYYRVLYNDAELTTLKSSFNKLATIDQLGLIADNFALAYADNQPIAKALDLLASVPQAAEPTLQIGSTSCRERVCPFVSITLVPLSLNKKIF